MDFLTKTYPTIPLSGDSELIITISNSAILSMKRHKFRYQNFFIRWSDTFAQNLCDTTTLVLDNTIERSKPYLLCFFCTYFYILLKQEQNMFKVHEMGFLDHILDFIYHICNQRYNFWNFTIIFFSSYRELEQTRSLFFTWGIIGLRLA